MITVTQDHITVETKTLKATFVRGHLTSLVSKLDGQEYVKTTDINKESVLQLIYPRGEVIDLVMEPFGSITSHRLSDRCAEIRFSCWDGDGVIVLTEDPESGDLIVEPSVYTSRPGLLACRWVLRGINDGLELVAPLFQGVRLRLDDPLLRNERWPWPVRWEAGLAIFAGKEGGFWVHTRDEHYRYKALHTAPAGDVQSVAFDTEVYGPVDNNLAAGSLAWRINVYQGDWTEPAGIYRDWAWHAFKLHEAEKGRPAWIHAISLALSWCICDFEILKALAEKVPPEKILLHVPNWRTDSYDENYPNFKASEEGRAFLNAARKAGFHVMPHCNAIDMDPTHPVYSSVYDFRYRLVDNKRAAGWAYDQERGVLSPPNGYSHLVGYRDKKVMVKIHAGLAMWRSILAEHVHQAVQDLSLDAVFLDVTHNTFNLHNCLVENMTPTEGMMRLLHHVAELEGGIVLGGEGLNEACVRDLSFAQVHLFKSSGKNIEGLERTGECGVNAFLFGRVTRAFGYSFLSGKTPEEELRMQIHEKLGAIPTLTVYTADEIRHPNKAVARVLEQAQG